MIHPQYLYFSTKFHFSNVKSYALECLGSRFFSSQNFTISQFSLPFSLVYLRSLPNPVLSVLPNPLALLLKVFLLSLYQLPYASLFSCSFSIFHFSSSFKILTTSTFSVSFIIHLNNIFTFSFFSLYFHVISLSSDFSFPPNLK